MENKKCNVLTCYTERNIQRHENTQCLKYIYIYKYRIELEHIEKQVWNVSQILWG